MPIKNVFYDHNENEMECYVNNEAQLFLRVGKTEDDSGYYEGWITLNRQDVKSLIAILQELEPQIQENPTE